MLKIFSITNNNTDSCLGRVALVPELLMSLTFDFSPNTSNV